VTLAIFNPLLRFRVASCGFLIIDMPQQNVMHKLSQLKKATK